MIKCEVIEKFNLKEFSDVNILEMLNNSFFIDCKVELISSLIAFNSSVTNNPLSVVHFLDNYAISLMS